MPLYVFPNQLLFTMTSNIHTDKSMRRKTAHLSQADPVNIRLTDKAGQRKDWLSRMDSDTGTDTAMTEITEIKRIQPTLKTCCTASQKQSLT